MKVEIFTDIGPEFKKLVTVELNCPCCGRKIRLPSEMIVDRIADKIEEHYRAESEYLHKENQKLRDIIQFGQEVQLICDVAKRL